MSDPVRGFTRRLLPAVALLAPGLLTAWAARAAVEPSHWVVGSWDVDYRPDDGGPFERPFQGLWSFTRDGVLLVSDQPPTRRRGPDGGRPLFGLGHGAWKSDGAEGAFLFRQSAALLSATSDPTVVITVKGRVRAGDPGAAGPGWTGRFDVTATDPAGQPLARGSGALAGRRIGTE